MEKKNNQEIMILTFPIQTSFLYCSGWTASLLHQKTPEPMMFYSLMVMCSPDYLLSTKQNRSTCTVKSNVTRARLASHLSKISSLHFCPVYLRSSVNTELQHEMPNHLLGLSASPKYQTGFIALLKM